MLVVKKWREMKGKPDAQPIIGSKIFYGFKVVRSCFFGVKMNIGIKELTA